MKLCFVRYFNSIKVRLEQNSDLLISFSYGFQFHKGTIRTVSHYVLSSIATEFQFHKGTIRTYRSESSSQAHSNFNSIKVRLEPC